MSVKCSIYIPPSPLNAGEAQILPVIHPHPLTQVIRIRDPPERPKPVARHMQQAVNTRIAAAATMPLSEVSQNVLIKVMQTSAGSRGIYGPGVVLSLS